MGYGGAGIDGDGRLWDYYNDTTFSIDGLDEMIDSLPDFDEFCETALKEAAPILENEMKKACRSTIMHEGESEMVNSIKASVPEPTKTDAWIVYVRPTGNSEKVGYYKTRGYRRRYKVSNALKAIWKEYGIPGKQAPQPFLQAATNAAEAAVVEKMQEIYNRMVGADES